eukprot:994684-Alexandrium_andersonii.AAC.1
MFSMLYEGGFAPDDVMPAEQFTWEVIADGHLLDLCIEHQVVLMRGTRMGEAIASRLAEALTYDGTLSVEE